MKFLMILFLVLNISIFSTNLDSVDIDLDRHFLNLDENKSVKIKTLARDKNGFPIDNIIPQIYINDKKHNSKSFIPKKVGEYIIYSKYRNIKSHKIKLFVANNLVNKDKLLIKNKVYYKRNGKKFNGTLKSQSYFNEYFIIEIKNGIENGKFLQFNDEQYNVNNDYLFDGFKKNGKLHNKAISYISGTNKIDNITNYKNGIKNGFYKKFDYKGNLLIEGYFKNDKADKIWKFYNKKSQLIGTGFGENGIYKGNWFTYSYKGDIKSYHKEYYEGEVIIYDENQEIGAIINYKNGIKHGLSKLFYRNKIVHEPYINGKLDGDYKEYNRLKRLTLLEQYKNGKSHGIYKKFYDNGNLEYFHQNKNGIPYGVHEEYYENGQLKNKYYIKKGKYEGIYLSYFENGQIKLKGNYKNHKKSGICIKYYANGSIRYKELYVDGKKNGEQFYYYPSGKLWKHEVYKNNKKISYQIYKDKENI